MEIIYSWRIPCCRKRWNSSSKRRNSLAGSILKLKEAIKNKERREIATPQEAIIDGKSPVPAISCKIDDKCGMIKKGRAADFIVLDPQMNLQATFLDGVCQYEAKQKKRHRSPIGDLCFCKKRLIVLSIFINSWKVDQIFLAKQRKQQKRLPSTSCLDT